MTAGRDQRPEIAPSRQRLTPADLDPDAVAAEHRRLEAERQRSRPVQPARASDERQADEEADLEESDVGVVQQVREAVRAHRGD